MTATNLTAVPYKTLQAECRKLRDAGAAPRLKLNAPRAHLEIALRAAGYTATHGGTALVPPAPAAPQQGPPAPVAQEPAPVEAPAALVPAPAPAPAVAPAAPARKLATMVPCPTCNRHPVPVRGTRPPRPCATCYNAPPAPAVPAPSYAGSGLGAVARAHEFPAVPVYTPAPAPQQDPAPQDPTPVPSPAPLLAPATRDRGRPAPAMLGRHGTTAPAHALGLEPGRVTVLRLPPAPCPACGTDPARSWPCSCTDQEKSAAPPAPAPTRAALVPARPRGWAPARWLRPARPNRAQRRAGGR